MTTPLAKLRTQVTFIQSEADFQAAVVKLARLKGWVVWSMPRYVRRCPSCGLDIHVGPDAGIPDLPFMIQAQPDGRTRLLVRELKSETGKLSPDQAALIKCLQDAGIDAGVWRPSDWPKIEEELS